MSIKNNIVLLLKKNNVDMNELGKKLNMSGKEISNKLDNIEEMKVSEINALVEILQIHDPINFFGV